MLLLTFSTGEQRLFDTTLLKGSAFDPLKDEKVLKDFNIFHGVMTWMNGDIDIAPETMYADSCKTYPYTDQQERLHNPLGFMDIISICPVAFEMYERLKKEYSFRTHR